MKSTLSKCAHDQNTEALPTISEKNIFKSSKQKSEDKIERPPKV